MQSNQKTQRSKSNQGWEGKSELSETRFSTFYCCCCLYAIYNLEESFKEKRKRQTQHMCAQEKKFPFNSNAPFLILKKKNVSGKNC